ncbi:hypothetical protein HYW99_00045 [Candidatus Woesearchaeota archaeon]|nr:hypothetical protein [Candidatus Woesearchaeota archaeon]
MFIRIKKIKGKEYAYEVKNEWTRKRSRQKVISYIGRVYRFNLKNDVDFLEFERIPNIDDYFSQNSKAKIINDLIKWELYRFDINRKEFLIEIENMHVKKDTKNVALLINEGFLCNVTLKNLLEFKLKGDETDAYRFAKCFIEAGIKVPKEIFIGIFGNL